MCALCPVRHAASSLVHICNMSVNDNVVCRKQIMVKYGHLLYFSPSIIVVGKHDFLYTLLPAISAVFV